MTKRLIKALILLYLVVFSWTSIAYADDNESPTVGVLNSITEGDIGDHLDYNCSQRQDKLHCHFEQNIIMPVKGSSNTCSIIHHNFDEDYILKANGLWVHETGPTGNCGAVDFSRFEKDTATTSGLTVWKYIAQTTYTNVSGDMFYGTSLLSCKKVKESGAEKQMVYQEPNKPEKLGCEYITH